MLAHPPSFSCISAVGMHLRRDGHTSWTALTTPPGGSEWLAHLACVKDNDPDQLMIGNNGLSQTE